jgi:hypothetical protein
MSRCLSAQDCPKVHRRDLSKNPTACGPCGQSSHLTRNTVAALSGFFVWLTNTKFPTPSFLLGHWLALRVESCHKRRNLPIWPRSSGSL